MSIDAPACSHGLSLDRINWTGRRRVRHVHNASHEGIVDPSTHRECAPGPITFDSYADLRGLLRASGISYVMEAKSESEHILRDIAQS